jgi:hypothetical protein
MPLNKKQLNEILKKKNLEIEKIVETYDDDMGTNYLCLKTTTIRTSVKKISDSVEHFNYNTLDADDSGDEEVSKERIEQLKKTKLTSDVCLKIPDSFFNEETEFFALHKIEANPVKKKYTKKNKPVWTLWTESFSNFSFDINQLNIPGTDKNPRERNNPYNHYTKFKSVSTFVPSLKFGIHSPYLLSSSDTYKISDDDEYDLVFHDYIVVLTDDERESAHILLTPI